MSISEVQRIEILAHSGVKMKFLSSLQEEGLIQIERNDFEGLGLISPSSEVSHLDHRLHRLSNALDYLSQWKQKGFAQKLFAPRPQLSWKRKEEVLGMDYEPLLLQIEKNQSAKADFLTRIKFLERELEVLRPLEDLALPVKSIRSTETTQVVLGNLPFSQFEEFQKLAEEEPIWFETVFADKRIVFLLMMYPNGDDERIRQALKERSFSFFEFSDPILNKAGEKDRVVDVMHKIQQEIAEKEQGVEELDREGKSLAVQEENLMLIHDILLNERERLLSSRLIGETKEAFFLGGWVRTADIKKLKAKLHPYADSVEYFFRPPLPDEDPPVILENPKVGKPFEIITKLYGLPQRGSLDPTLALAPFFFLFVGLAVSEAGYGLLVALMSFLCIKFVKPKGGMLSFLRLLFILGISTVILGTLVGSWFGFPLRKLMVLDPLKNPLSFLFLSLALGFVQVWFGTLLNMIYGIKKKDYLQAVFVQGGWLLLLPSLLCYFLFKQPVWGILALTGASGIVFFASPSKNPIARFFGGLYSLYNISRYLADILSYSRLLALGLATTVIAMVVNTLCQTALGIPWVGWLLAVLIFVGGHLFNLAISFLGGFVHSMRLQFVEFFSKFFKSGGKPFKPFELESKYVEFI